MTSGIAPLPQTVVHLIAAGEVIDSLAAVVRELAENALDAGATRIGVSVWTEQWRVRVVDNGSGMPREDLEQAAAPHSTSKIRESQDLWSIRSLGFRGEALHSLAQLSQLTLLSRRPQADTGWHLTYDARGLPLQTTPVAIAPGTIVIADDIFRSWSARRQGLPPLPQQLRAIQSVIHQLALCHPHVTWQVQQNDRDWFGLFPGQSARLVLPQLLRDVQVSDLQEVTLAAAENEPGAGSLYVLVGLPDRCHRHRPDWVRLAINGRPVQLPELEQQVFRSLRRSLPRDRYPVSFVHFQVPPSQIDWNRHPAKTEVYLHQLDQWRDLMEAAFEEALRLNPTAVPDAVYTSRMAPLLKTAEAESGYLLSRTIDPSDSTIAPADSEALVPLRAIAQVHNTYILAEHPDGVWLVEQHIAHERVLYEQLCDRWQLIPLETPMLLQGLSPAQVEQLQRLDLEVELFGEQTWVVRTAPALLAQRPDCSEALLELSLGGDLQTAQVATACRSAIRNGTSLSLPEMQTLLDQWQQTRHPRTCPHGRPICLTLEESALARFFRRHWVIGKSHGI